MSGNSEYEDKKSNLEERLKANQEVSDAFRKFDEVMQRLQYRKNKEANEESFY